MSATDTATRSKRETVEHPGNGRVTITEDAPDYQDLWTRRSSDTPIPYEHWKGVVRTVIQDLDDLPRGGSYMAIFFPALAAGHFAHPLHSLELERHVRLCEGAWREAHGMPAASDDDNAVARSYRSLGGWGVPRTAGDAMAPLPEREWLVDGFMHTQSVTVVHAPPGKLKTMLVVDLGVCIASGRPWLPPRADDQILALADGNLQIEAPDGMATHRSRVLHLDFDQGAHRTQERIAAAIRGHGLDPDDVDYLWYSVPMPWLDADSTRMMDELVALVRALDARMVIVDTLSTTAMNVEENSSAMSAVMTNWRRVAEKANCHVLVIHHSNKYDGQYRGSSAIQAGVDTMWKVSRDPKKLERVTVECDKTRGAWFSPIGAEFEYEHMAPGEDNTLKRAVFYALPEAEFVSEAQRVFNVIKAADGTMGQTDLIALASNKTGLSRRKVQEALAELRSDGRVVEERRGNKRILRAVSEEDKDGGHHDDR